ncbi:beta-hexosaminidase [Prolixibacteraceae bacterium JC049]|nr:beta-hexosaminidase [Prolixibacteraceae bacterium JC049]
MRIISKGILVISALFLMAACSVKHETKVYNQGINVVPKPMELTQNEGNFELSKKTKVVVANNPELKKVAEYFVEKVKLATGFDLQITSEATSSNFVEFSLAAKSTKAEGYTLNVTKKGAKVAAKTAKGAFYGMQTLMQLLPAEIESSTVVNDVNWTIPAVSVNDAPRYPYRGMHLDVCRHFYPIEFIKKQLDVMAMFKMNYFHWHLTEDQGWRIEIKKYPKLTEIGSKRMEGEGHEYGGFYTQEQVKEIVKYAQDRFITVIPEIELPGHALGALTAYPEYSCTGGPFKVRNIWGVEPDVYCAGKEETFQFLNDIIDEVVALFPSEYFHIGGDECPKKRWEKCKLCQKRMKKEGLKDEHELQSYFIQRVEKMLLKHGKKMIGWDEILEGGLAPTATVMSWRGEKGGIKAANEGHDVIMTPGNWCYLDHYQGSNKVEPVAIGGYTTLAESYSYDPQPKEIAADKAKHILGTQGNVWTEYMYTAAIAEYRIYPRIIALAEVNWTPKAKKNYEDFEKRMNNQFVRLDKHNINYHIPLPEGPANKVVFTDKAELKFTTVRPVKMVYTLDGSQPTATSTEYTAPIVITKNTTVKIASVLISGKMSKVRTITVEKQTPAKAVALDHTHKGLKMKVAEGHFVKVADLKKAKNWKDGKIKDIGKAHKLFDMKKPSAVIIEGYINIPETGVYRFSSNLDQLHIDGKLLVNNDGEVKRFSRNDAMVALEKGYHPVKMIYINNIIGGWPQNWNGPKVQYRLKGTKKYNTVKADMYVH